MDTAALEKLERVARRMPVRNLQMERADGTYGEIYFAYGDADDGSILGVWGSQGVGHGPIEFTPNTKKKDVRQVLVDHAEGFISLLAEKGFFDG